MSITKGFEQRAWKEPPFEDRYSGHDVKQLLAHTRALEAVLIEIVEKDTLFGMVVGLNHESATKLAKLLEEVE